MKIADARAIIVGAVDPRDSKFDFDHYFAILTNFLKR